MKYDELSEFTWEELENLTWGDLELSPTELLHKIVTEYTAEEIPSSVLFKLHKICESLTQICIDNNVEIPPQISSIKTKTKLSKTEMLGVVGSILTIIDVLTSILFPVPIPQEVHIQNNYYNTYIVSEYNEDINSIIEDLEQSQDITVNVTKNHDNALPK